MYTLQRVRKYGTFQEHNLSIPCPVPAWDFEHFQGWGRWLCGSGIALQSGNVLEQLGGITCWQK